MHYNTISPNTVSTPLRLRYGSNRTKVEGEKEEGRSEQKNSTLEHISTLAVPGPVLTPVTLSRQTRIASPRITG